MKGAFRFLVAVCAMSMALTLVAQSSQRRSILDRQRSAQRGAQRGAAQNADRQQQGGGEGQTLAEKVKAVTGEKGTNGVPRLAFSDTPLEIVIMAYAETAGKIVLPTPNLPKTQITLQSPEGRALTKEEYLEAIEVTLTMHGVVLEPFDRIFLRAFERKSVRTQGIRTAMNVSTNGIPEKGKVISQLIRLEHITAEEAQKAMEGFKDPAGLFQVFERNNSILVTDTQENINRMLEIVHELDVANPVTEDVFVRQIQYAVATDIKTALETIVSESQKDSQQQAKSGPKESGTPGFSSRQPTPSQGSRLLNRSGSKPPDPPAATPNATMTAAVSDADRGMIRGKVLILADERSNKLIVITAKSNMDFFDKVIETLDVETTPEVSVEVVRLKYADAEEVASMLNDLIGNGSSSSQSKNNQNANTARGGSANRNLTQSGAKGGQPGGASQQRRQSTSNPTFAKNSSSLGELNKDNIKILADKRINGIVVMARRADMKAVKEVIEDMDVKLSQVLIETVIVQVELGDDLQTGIDWVQRGREKIKVQKTNQYGQKLYWTEDTESANDDGVVTKMIQTTTDTGVPVYTTAISRDAFFNNGSYMLGGGGGSASSKLSALMGVASSTAASAASNATENAVYANPIGGGINYLLKSDKLNIAAVIQASKGDSRTKVLASPILMTVDNKEATIEATDMIYLFSGYQYSGSTYSGTQVRNYEKRDIGLTVKVTPKINPNGTVMLTVEQTFETQGADQNVPNESGGTDPYATVTTRKIQSDVSVENRQTVVMGGLTKKTNTESESGIPILKDIPWIGKWLFSSVNQKEARSELLVFMTPYVLDDADAAQAEAIRRKKALSDPRPWEDSGWSASPLADPVSKKEQLRRLNDEWKRQDEERSNQKAMEEAKEKRAKKLAEMDEADRKAWAERHEKEIADELERFNGEQKDLRELIDEIRLKHETKVDEQLAPAADPAEGAPAEPAAPAKAEPAPAPKTAAPAKAAESAVAEPARDKAK